MSKEHASSSIAIKSSPLPPNPGGKRRLRPPADLVLKATKPTTVYPDDGSDPATSCQTCSKSLPRNPQLCDGCQIWNDAHHIFECLRDLSTLDKLLDERQPVTLGQILTRKACLMCKAVGEAALESLPTDDQDIRDQFSQVEIRNYGPFCLNKDQYGALDPALYQKSGLRLVDPDDLRFPASSVPSERMSSHLMVPLRTVVYIVMTAPLGMNLRNWFPHLDEYKPLEKVKEHWSDDRHVGVHRSLDPAKHEDVLQPTFGLQVDLSYQTGQTGLSAVSPWESPFIDTSLFIKLLATCDNKHDVDRTPHGREVRKCTTSTEDEPLPAGFKVIDTHRHCIIDLPAFPLPEYVALSYTWGGTTEVKELQLELDNKSDLYKDGSLKRFGGIPDLILDAIKFCASMGKQYLWVDRLCIVQDDSDFKMGQINAMDRIYQMATFTLVAAVPSGVGLPGVIGRSRKPRVSNFSRRFDPKFRFIADNFMFTVLKSFWNTRGWTYQERILTRRAIYITEWQAYWVCQRHSEQEEIGEIATSYNPWDMLRFDMYVATVADYTLRNLTYESDILNAFAGIGNRFAKKMGKALLYGLPERFFAQALLWEHEKDIERRTQAPNIPTWSWAAWRGQSRWDLNSRAERLRVGTLVRFHTFEPDGRLRRISENEAWFFKNLKFDALDALPKLDPLYPEMRFMPSHEDTETDWRATIQNPWTVVPETLDKTDLEALSSPNRVVFRTTSALVTLRIPQLLNYEPVPGYTKLDICNHKDRIVGQVAPLPQLWIESNIDMAKQQEVIVIAAGIASEAGRYARTHTTLHISGEAQGPRIEDSLWYLHVMLISRDRDDVARRVGIGIVEMQQWNDCGPEWRTVVLA